MKSAAMRTAWFLNFLKRAHEQCNINLKNLLLLKPKKKKIKSIFKSDSSKKKKKIQRKINIPKTYKTSQRIQKKICT